MTVSKQITQITSRKYPTKYASTNGVEWFAENFALYNMKKEYLVDPKFIKLIEEIQK